MDNIIAALAKYFSPKFKDKLKRCENLEALIKKLTKKELCIEEQLQTDLTDPTRETLNTKLAVLKVQKEKAEILLKETQN